MEPKQIRLILIATVAASAVLVLYFHRRSLAEQLAASHRMEETLASALDRYEAHALELLANRAQTNGHVPEATIVAVEEPAPEPAPERPIAPDTPGPVGDDEA